VKKVVDKLKKLVDPRGPLGEVLSPSEVFKERAGLPVSTPHVQRDVNFVPASALVLQPPQFKKAEELAHVPISRMRLVSRYIEEHYQPVYDTPRFSGMAEAIRANTTVIGWNVTQTIRSPHCDCLQATLEMEQGKLIHRECGRARRHISDEDLVEHLQRLQIAPSDEFYNTDYPTIPGKDPIVVDGKVLRGEPVYRDGKMVHDGIIRQSTRMTRGRREYREKTKNMVLWDKGVVKERQKAYDAYNKSFLDGVRPRMFKADKQMMPRKIGEL
jgi:hypothetical protein